MDISEHEMDALRLIGGAELECRDTCGGIFEAHGVTKGRIFQIACNLLFARGLIAAPPQLTDEGKALLVDLLKGGEG